MALNNVQPIRLGDLEFSLIQGGMGVGISKENLAAAVAEQGGAGIIASVGLNFLGESNGEKYDSSTGAFRETIRLARRKTNGVIGVNIMHVLTDYQQQVEAAVEEGVDLIISGAGIPKDLPSFLNGKNIKLLPIVSSARLAEMICKAWAKYDHLPDGIIVEGPKAGGHLGYSCEQLEDSDFIKNGLERIVSQVVQAVKPYETQRKIPVIVAGGIFYGGDIKKYQDLGAAGVQMATRFVTTEECDADIKFKEEYLRSRKEDIIIIVSPVGMPGRAIDNEFLAAVRRGETRPNKCGYHCIKSCKPRETQYCIASALINAQKGNLENGYAFCGSNAHLCDKIVPVREVFESLDSEYTSEKTSE
jgi:nitronate monooxygenase